MRVAIILVSDDQSACELFDKEQQALIPRSLRELERIKSIGLDFFTNVYRPSKTKFCLEDHILHTAKNSEVVAILTDSRHAALTRSVTKACFVGHVEFNPDFSSYKNLIQATLTRLIKNLAHVCGHMQDAGSRYALLLPTRNFIAEEIERLQELFRSEALASEFITTIDCAISELNDRRKPKRTVNYQDKYYVDDEQKFFSFGKESHSSVETGHPHLPLCILEGNFRFGTRIENKKHYNVSRDLGDNGKISGDFISCHDTPRSVKDWSHLNMFSNDYFN